MKRLILIFLCLMTLGCSGSDKKQVAILAYTKVIKLNPNDAVAYKNRGNAYSDKGKYDKAISDYTRAIKINPKFAVAYYDRGNAYINKGYIDQAILDITKAIEIDSNFAPAYLNRGIAYHKQKKYDKAILDYNRAIEINPKYTEAYNSRGLAYKRNNNLDQAISDFTKAIEIDPKYIFAYKNRSLIYSQEGNYNEVIADYTKTIEINPKDADAYLLRADAYVLNKEPEKALNDFCKVKSLGFKCPPDVNKLLDEYFPLNRPLNNKLDIVTEREKETIYNLFIRSNFSGKSEMELDESLASINRMISEANSNYALWGYQMRGDIYAYKGNFDQAISDYAKSLKIDSNFTFAYAHRGIAYYYKGNYDQAVFDLTNAIKTVKLGRAMNGELEPEGLIVINLGYDYQGRGIVYYSAGEYKQAISDFTEAIRNMPGFMYCYYFRGRSYDNLGNHDQAVSDYNKATEIEREYNNKVNAINGVANN